MAHSAKQGCCPLGALQGQRSVYTPIVGRSSAACVQITPLSCLTHCLPRHLSWFVHGVFVGHLVVKCEVAELTAKLAVHPREPTRGYLVLPDGSGAWETVPGGEFILSQRTCLRAVA